MSANVKEMSRTGTRRKLGVLRRHMGSSQDGGQAFGWVLFLLLGIDATTELQPKHKKEIDKAAFERPGWTRHLRSWVIDHHPHRWKSLATFGCVFFSESARVSLMHDVNRRRCGEKREMRSRADGKDLMSAGSISAFI